MRKIILMTLCLGLLAGQARATVDWESKGLQIAGEILANPAAFLYEFQQDLESTTPLPPGKRYGFQTGLWGGVLPTIGVMPSLSGKFRLHGEGRIAPGLPQLDVIGGYWNSPLADMASDQSDDINDTKFKGHYYGFLLSSSVSPRVRTFWGFKKSQLKAKISFAPTADIKLLGTPVNDIDTGFEDSFFVVGLESPKGLNKLWSIQLNYGMDTQTIASKVSWYGKYFELGLNIYPEGVFVVHPVWNFHLNF